MSQETKLELRVKPGALHQQRPDVLNEFILEVASRRAKYIEDRIRLILRPKPKWCPLWLWMKFVTWMLAIETERLH